MFRLVSILLSISLSSVAQADVKNYMDQMLQEIHILKPYIVSESEYKDPKNFAQIDESLKRMVSLSENISHEGKIRNSAFGISSEVLTEQLKESELVYRVGNKGYSLWMLRSTLSVCMSCHTQLPSASTRFDFSNKEHQLTRPFDEAEFLFIVRNFEKAMSLYQQVIAEYPKNGVNPESLKKAIARELYYYVRVKRDIPGLIKVLNANLKNKQLPQSAKDRLSGLKNAAQEAKSEGYPEFKADQQAELKNYAETQLKKELTGEFDFSAGKELAYLKTASVLYKYLSDFPQTSLKPEILYWLSFCERRYEPTAFYSLPELYLKQCIVEHPQSSIAPSCLREYQDLVTLAYTGSSGVNIPKEVQKEMKGYKKAIEAKQPKK